ncbi:MAG: enoyl-CoA hydratase/isomerase family protein [Sphingomonadales bacterium]|nr:enoyl-CoA hydratase/isomerase family protein [Sphingomonadales bacterium]
MDFTPFLLDPRRLWQGENPPDLPLGIVDCDVANDWPDRLDLPPFPVIALGRRSHPLAAALDAVIEPPVPLAAVVRQVVAHPRAAAVITDLLRLLPSLAAGQGLVAESLAYATLQAGAEHLAWRTHRAPAMLAPPGRVRVARVEDCLTLVLDRPDVGNAIDTAMRDALSESLELARLDPAIARIRLTATGRCFSLGADLAEFGTATDPAAAHAIRRRSLPARLLADLGDRLAVHVDGACVGAGLEMAAFAGRITASPRAWFQLPELAMGVLPGAGGCVSLTRRIGAQRTALMILSGRRISALTAQSWGLVDQLTGDESGADVL